MDSDNVLKCIRKIRRQKRAQVKIEDIIYHLDYAMKRALEGAAIRVLPDANFDRNQLFREFVRAVGRKCSTWESVPDHYVESE